MNKYSFLYGLKKNIIVLAIAVIPIIIEILPADWLNITLSGALLMFWNWLKVAKSIKV